MIYFSLYCQISSIKHVQETAASQVYQDIVGKWIFHHGNNDIDGIFLITFVFFQTRMATNLSVDRPLGDNASLSKLFNLNGLQTNDFD